MLRALAARRETRVIILLRAACLPFERNFAGLGSWEMVLGIQTNRFPSFFTIKRTRK